MCSFGKNYEDEMEIYLEHPAGGSVLVHFFETLGAQPLAGGKYKLLILQWKPAPYHVTQEIYVDFLPQDEKTPYVDSGVWKIILAARNIKNGGNISCGFQVAKL